MSHIDSFKHQIIGYFGPIPIYQPLQIIDPLKEPYNPFFHVRYSNIMLIPPNMPIYANGGNTFKSSLVKVK